MSGRRGGNGIRGPQSALTDFLAANNISAAQIRNDYEQRRQRVAQTTDHDATATATATPDTATADEPVIEGSSEDESIIVASSRSKKRKRAEQDAEKIKKLKKADKKKHLKKLDSEDESDFGTDEDVVRRTYKKSRPAPGQFANCELCSKRFTVTPYSKEGPDGGLLCTPCGKEYAKDLKALDKAAKKPAVRKKRKLESDKMDGLAGRGPKSLQQTCLEKVVANHTEVEELGDLPQKIVERLSAIFSKHRVLKPNTLPLFLRPDLDDVVLHDAAYLDVNDYKQVFAVVPHVRKLALGNACQFKDEVVEYMIGRCKQLEDIRIYAPNLVTNGMWTTMFEKLGPQLKVIKLKWLDASFEDANVADITNNCKGLQRLKLKFCRRLGEEAVKHISQASSLQHLSLRMSKDISNELLVSMVEARGPDLRTLSLEGFQDADDSVLLAIKSSCKVLGKLRFSENDTATDGAFEALFSGWDNPPLTFVDVNCTRHIDNNNADGPEEAIGMAGKGFTAMMAHSGPSLRHLDISSCRHIEHRAFLDVFNGDREYPNLQFINISFCNRVDTPTIVGIFKSCPGLKKLVAFGCFDVGEVVVPRDVALIGVPKAQDAIEQYGVGINVEEALGRMVDVAA